MIGTKWPEHLPVAQVRIARPTRRLRELIEFYCEGLGLEVVGSFTAHAGYSGVMLGLPGCECHLEFTEHEESEANYPPPSRDNLLVFYIPERAAIERILARLTKMNYEAVAPENPYWKERGVNVEGPDGWRVVLMNTAGI